MVDYGPGVAGFWVGSTKGPELERGGKRRLPGFVGKMRRRYASLVAHVQDVPIRCHGRTGNEKK